MKKIVMICGLVLALTATMALSAGATMISGSVSFAGADTMDNPDLTLATKFLTMGPSIVTGGTGDYAGLVFGTSATFTPFTFNPLPTNIIPLWTLTFAGVTYSFDSTSIVIILQIPTQITFHGNGTAYITNFDATPGTWDITSNSSTGGTPPQTTYSFSAGTTATPVPEPATMLLLGSGLVGIGIFARRKFRRT